VVVVDPIEQVAVVDPTEPVVVVDPTEPVVVVDPTEPVVVVDPTEPPTAPPTAPPTEPARCEKEVANFKAKSGLDFEPSFDGDSCDYLAKQCNGEKCFCVNPKSGKPNYGGLEVPARTDYDCSCKNCFRQL
jgi:hypothetical protein